MRTTAILYRNAVSGFALLAFAATIGAACNTQTSKGASSSSVPNASAAPAKVAKPPTMPLGDFCKQLRAKLDSMVAACQPKPATEDLFKLLKLMADEMADDDNFCTRLTNVDILAEKAPACLAEIRTQWDAALVRIQHTPACRAAFVGKTAPGGKCRSDLECIANSFCVADPSSSDPLASVCSPPMAAGVTCIEHRGEACGPDLDCSSGKCVPRPISGETCSSADQNCGPGLTCLMETSAAKEGKCGPRRKAGQACHRWTDCDGAYCVAHRTAGRMAR